MPLSHHRVGARLLTGAALALGLLSAGCTEFDRLSSDDTRLVRGAGRVEGGRLIVRLDGVEAARREAFAEALSGELADGNLFHTVEVLSAETATPSSATVLELKLDRSVSTYTGSAYSGREGWLVRFEGRGRLLDGAGQPVLAGRATGIAYDDKTEFARLDYAKKEDIAISARRDLAACFADALREMVNERVEEALAALPVLRLAPGVGPLKLAIVNVDLKRAHPSTQPAAISAELAAALGLAGPDLDVVPLRRVARAIDRIEIDADQRFTGLTLPDVLSEKLRRHLTTRLVVLVTVSAGAGGVTMEAALIDLRDRETRPLGNVKAEHAGLGAVRLASVALARRIIGLIAATRFEPETEPESPQDKGSGD